MINLILQFLYAYLLQSSVHVIPVSGHGHPFPVQTTSWHTPSPHLSSHEGPPASSTNISPSGVLHCLGEVSIAGKPDSTHSIKLFISPFLLTQPARNKAIISKNNIFFILKSRRAIVFVKHKEIYPSLAECFCKFSHLFCYSFYFCL